jgi:uncharacterized membrane protein
MGPIGNWLFYGLSIVIIVICVGVFMFLVSNSSVGLKHSKINDCEDPLLINETILL